MVKTVIILHNIRSAENVGSIFRTSDACGVSKIYLTGYTPAPLDRFGRMRRDIAKASLGAESSVPWEEKKTITPLLSYLKKNDFILVAVEQSATSIDYKKFKVKNPIALIFGNEVTGLPELILKRCDATIEIPMRGMKESLNVAVSVGIVLSRLLDL